MLHFQPFTNSQGQFGYTVRDENDAALAQCLCRQEGMYLTFLSLSYPSGDEDLARGLVRSACAYGANRGAFVARAAVQEGFSACLCRMGFAQKEECVETEIPGLLMGQCRADGAV